MTTPSNDGLIGSVSQRARPAPARRLRTVVTAVALLVILGSLPVLAYTNNRYLFYDGVYCDWAGTHEHYDTGNQYSRGVGTTSIQSGYPNGCDQTRVKIRWEPYGFAAKTDIQYGLSAASTGTLYSMEYLYWTDHDVRIDGTSTWHGFKLTH